MFFSSVTTRLQGIRQGDQTVEGGKLLIDSICCFLLQGMREKVINMKIRNLFLSAPSLMRFWFEWEKEKTFFFIRNEWTWRLNVLAETWIHLCCLLSETQFDSGRKAISFERLTRGFLGKDSQTCTTVIQFPQVTCLRVRSTWWKKIDIRSHVVWNMAIRFHCFKSVLTQCHEAGSDQESEHHDEERDPYSFGKMFSRRKICVKETQKSQSQSCFSDGTSQVTVEGEFDVVACFYWGLLV